MSKKWHTVQLHCVSSYKTPSSATKGGLAPELAEVASMSIFLKHGRLITCLRASRTLSSLCSLQMSLHDWLVIIQCYPPQRGDLCQLALRLLPTPTPASQSLAIQLTSLLSSKRSCNNRNYFLCLHCVFPHHSRPLRQRPHPPCSPLYPYCLGWCLAHSRCPILTRYSIKLLLIGCVEEFTLCTFLYAISFSLKTLIFVQHKYIHVSAHTHAHTYSTNGFPSPDSCKS